MTVSGLELCQTNTSNIASHHKYYPAQIAVHHHQLRHFISTSEPNRIYYANEYDIYRLDTKTQQTSLLATLQFQARCLAADYGWVCIGGEQNGQCAFIRVESEDGIPKCFGHFVHEDELGGEIVNSMNIHLMHDDLGRQIEPVVLISNNDRTVKIYSLTQRHTLTTLKHDTPMNYAALSPDSQIIAAVGDSDLVHFYKRSRIDQPDPATNATAKYTLYEWKSFATPAIPTGDEVYDDYSFAVTFSPSGNMCAASAQGGAISVFDMQSLLDPDTSPNQALICTFRASRPTLCGCVRAMAFSPEPWDLLAWAEDHGRVGIADMRQMFVRRQMLELNKEAAKIVIPDDTTPTQYQNLELTERLKQQFRVRPRLMQAMSVEESTVGPIDQSTSELDSARGLSTRDFSYHQGLDLDARERSVIEALETTMDDVEQLARPYSLNYTSSPRYRPSTSNLERDGEHDARSHVESTRSGPRPHQPRRRTSVILSDSVSTRHLAPTESPRARITASPGRMTDDEDMPTMSTNDLTPTARGASSSQPLPYDIPASDPWHVIQSALEAARQPESAQSLSSNRPTTLPQIEAALEEERLFGLHLERQLEAERQLSVVLRGQLASQERQLRVDQRALQIEQRELVAQSESLEPLVNRQLQRELETEQQYGEQRLQELETEIRLGSSRARRLELQRARLIGSIAQGETTSTATSEHTTTLPTTNLRPSSQIHDIVSTIQRREVAQRQRLTNIQDLEQQVRRAESRIASASSEIQTLENAISRSANHNLSSRPAERTPRTTTTTTYNPSSSFADISDHANGVRARAAIRRAELLALNPERMAAAGAVTAPTTTTATTITNAATPPSRTSELTGRAIEADQRLARMMFFSGPRALDNNGNWLPGGAFQRVLGRSAASGEPASTTTNDILREAGVGTTGIGWSPDGRYLYAGSEEGIFEFKINMRDRMTFPGIEMR